MPPTPPSSPQRRLWLAGAVVFVVAAGLASRRYPVFPDALGNYPGDALWALMIFLGVAFLRPRIAPFTLGFVALAICYAVEFAQLLQTPWLNSIRSTRIGQLVLGSGFDWLDLCAYPVGVLIGVLVDAALFRDMSQRKAWFTTDDMTVSTPASEPRRRIAKNCRAAIKPLLFAMALCLAIYGGMFCWHFEVFGRPALNRERGWLGPCLRHDPHTFDVGGAGYYESSDYRLYNFYRPLCRAWIWMQGLPYGEVSS